MESREDLNALNALQRAKRWNIHLLCEVKTSIEKLKQRQRQLECANEAIDVKLKTELEKARKRIKNENLP